MRIATILGLASGLAVTVSVAGISASHAADTYGFDKGHTKVMFSWNHLGLSTQWGRFDEVDGTIMFDPENVTESSVDVTIQVASIDTDVPELDDHLKSADFFEVESHPTITFKSREIRQTGKDAGQVVGDLTIKGNTNPVVLDVTFNFAGEHPLSQFNENYAGAQYATFSAKTQVLRSDFGVDLFAPLTSDTIDIIIEAELRKQE